MGKYMKKSKLTPGIALMELSSTSSSIGVRTRAKTLADLHSSLSYLQLRSRRLPKPKPPSTAPPPSGDNSLDFQHQHAHRESTPCSLIRTPEDSIETPSSSTRRRGTSSTYQNHNSRRIIPTQREIEEFFALAEQHQARLFIEKYNFDIRNGLPLPGRYEWVAVTP